MTPDSHHYVDAFFAHQPIFDLEGKIWGYKLLYRNDSQAQEALLSDEMLATLETLANLALSPDDHFRRARLVLCFPWEGILEQNIPDIQSDLTIINIPDTDFLDESYLQPLLDLKKRGFSIALKITNPDRRRISLYAAADILCFDIDTFSPEAFSRLMPEINGKKPVFMAEKVETNEQRNFAKAMGCSLFHGFFFQRPQNHTVRKITSSEGLKLRLLAQLENPEIEINQINDLIKQDVSLGFRLINLLNSPAYGIRSKIQSVKQAVIFLGLKQLKIWLRTILLTDLHPPDISRELSRASLQRAKFLELLSMSSHSPELSESLFTLGLFSHIDALLDMPMEKAIKLLDNLDNNVTDALLGEDTPFSNWLELVVCIEHSDWISSGSYTAALHIDTTQIMPCYTQAREWSYSVLSVIS